MVNFKQNQNDEKETEKYKRKVEDYQIENAVKSCLMNVLIFAVASQIGQNFESIPTSIFLTTICCQLLSFLSKLVIPNSALTSCLDIFNCFSIIAVVYYSSPQSFYYRHLEYIYQIDFERYKNQYVDINTYRSDLNPK